MLADKLRAAADFGVSVANGITWTNKPNFDGAVDNPFTNSARGIAYGNGIFMAVGENGKCATSTDGVTWTLNYAFFNSFGNLSALGIAYAAGQGFLVVGANGTARISNDNGGTWSLVFVSTAVGSIQLNAAAWNGTRWVVIADGGKCATATTATGTWTNNTSFTTAYGSANQPRAIIWNGTRFAVVGSGGRWVTSTDGLTWANLTGFGSVFVTSNIAYGVAWSTSGVWCVVGVSGRCATSSDATGTNWTLQTGLATAVGSATMWSVKRLRGTTFFAVGSNGKCATSTNGSTWTNNTSFTSAFGARIVYDIADSGSTMAAVGTIADGFGAGTSSTGSTWTITGSLSSAWATYPDMNDVIWIPSINSWFAVGSLGKNARSLDSSGDSWTSSAAFTTAFISTNTANSVAYSPELGLYVVVGSSGKCVTSTNDTTWTNQTSFTDAFGSLNVATSVVWNGNIFCAVGSAGKCATSTNGTAWTNRTSFTTAMGSGVDIAAVVWNGTIFCAVGTDNSGSGTYCVTSPDGVTWTAQPGMTVGNWRDIAWNGSIFCAVGVSSTCTTSPDGITWTSQTAQFETAAPGTGVVFNSIVWTGTNFVTVGESRACLTSFDGVTWSSQTTSFGDAIGVPAGLAYQYKPANSVAWNGSLLMAVTDVATCVTSP